LSYGKTQDILIAFELIEYIGYTSFRWSTLDIVLPISIFATTCHLTLI